MEHAFRERRCTRCQDIAMVEDAVQYLLLMYITLKKMDKMAELFGIAFRKIFCLMVRITKENLMYIVGFYKKKYLK